MDNHPAQCAALPYRMNGGLVEVLLVTPRGGEGWIIPKGKVEAKLGVPGSAAQEAVEEGGVRGEIEQTPFDQYRHGGTDDGPLVAVYLMRVTKEMSSWRESHQRERRWATLDDAPRLIIDPGLARVMRAAADHLSTHAPATWPSDEPAPPSNARMKLVGSAVLIAAALGLAAAFLT
ncbi:NUDIX hydrolase [Longimicrobium sp.]|uniref:NUDIX hydrolase n=1 Tax=Longimicrobium sp. TaxID=2029185 RepID=UPI003B3AEE1C